LRVVAHARHGVFSQENDGKFTWKSGLDAGRWIFNNTNVSMSTEFRYVVDTPTKSCPLRRPSYRAVMECLRNKSIAFIGDSVTRFQAINLFVYLESGSYPVPCCLEHGATQYNDWTLTNGFASVCGYTTGTQGAAQIVEPASRSHAF
jgi:hypothetical protein